MADDVMKLLADEDMRRAFGEKGREQAIQRYGSDKIIPQYISFYEKVLDNAVFDNPISAVNVAGVRER